MREFFKTSWHESVQYLQNWTREKKIQRTSKMLLATEWQMFAKGILCNCVFTAVCKICS